MRPLLLASLLLLPLLACASGGGPPPAAAPEPAPTVEDAIRGVAAEMGLRAHVDVMTGGLHRHLVPNIQVTVSGADRAGIVAQVTGALAAAGLNILELESDVAGSEDKPLYVMQIAGLAEVPVEQLAQAVAGLRAEGVDVRVEPIETLVG